MIKTKVASGGRNPLIVHISSFGGVSYSFNVAYGVGKAGVDRMAKDMHRELNPFGISCISYYPGVVRTERMTSMLDGGEWTKRTGLACPSSLIETPTFSGRVIAALYAADDSQKVLRSGEVHVGAEVAKMLGVNDVNGKRAPSIRSLKFLIPALVLAKWKDAGPDMESRLVDFSPDILLPMAFMADGAPDQ